jgi:hypothetical protein
MSRFVGDTAWRYGRLDARLGPGRVLFGRMYEDSAIEMEAFPPGGRIFAIASAGCTAMALAPDHEVVAVDVNPAQLEYAERRIAGEPPVPGTVERLMGMGRAFAPLVGWWPGRLRCFLALCGPSQQISYWHDHLDTQRFRTAFDAMLSINALGRVYDSAFLDFLPVRFGAVLRARMERCFARHANATNPYVRALLLGEGSDPPPSTRPQGITLVHADAADFLERQPAGSFDGFTLSNILDGAAEAYKRRLTAAVRHAARPGSIVVLRSFREPKSTLLTNHAANDRAVLWGIVDVRPTASFS